MATALANSAVSGLDPVLSKAPHRVGRVALVVRDLDRVADFYQAALGLRIVERSPGLLRLGTGASVLLELRHDPQARVRSRREAGLFHTAFLLPERVDLGAWLSHAMAEGISLTGAADHLVSEALYLNDPEGNGIEIYVDRPSAEWRWSGNLIEMATDPLDLDALVREASTRAWSGFPDEGVIGHVHLQVGDLSDADGFYRDLLGFDIMTHYPGASFYGSGGYHHQLAGNIWNSRGAAVRSDHATGLADVELPVDDDVLAAVRSRSPAAAESGGKDGITLRDPWGTSITLRSAPANHMKGRMA
jgi:catechol 2,3-dioxygenase